MWKYLKFGLRFFITYYRHKTYEYFGNLPYYKQVMPGTVAKVLAGGEFKYTDYYLCTFSGWVKYESNESQIVNSDIYKQRQLEIQQEIRRLKEFTD